MAKKQHGRVMWLSLAGDTSFMLTGQQPAQNPIRKGRYIAKHLDEWFDVSRAFIRHIGGDKLVNRKKPVRVRISITEETGS